MAALVIRNIDAKVKERLRVRAARNGRSMEAELRHILGTVLSDETSREVDLAEAIRRRLAPLGGVDLQPQSPIEIPPPPDFGL